VGYEVDGVVETRRPTVEGSIDELGESSRCCVLIQIGGKRIAQVRQILNALELRNARLKIQLRECIKLKEDRTVTESIMANRFLLLD